LDNRNKIFDKRHLKLAIVDGYLFGSAFGVRAIHRCKVAGLMRTQLESFILGPPTPPPTSRATAPTKRKAKKRKATESGDDRDNSAPITQPGHTKGPGQEALALNQSRSRKEGLQPASAQQEVGQGG
jgi:hypothetical protein